jgi:hypothetical protein
MRPALLRTERKKEKYIHCTHTREVLISRRITLASHIIMYWIHKKMHVNGISKTSKFDSICKYILKCLNKMICGGVNFTEHTAKWQVFVNTVTEIRVPRKV